MAPLPRFTKACTCVNALWYEYDATKGRPFGNKGCTKRLVRSYGTSSMRWFPRNCTPHNLGTPEGLLTSMRCVLYLPTSRMLNMILLEMFWMWQKNGVQFQYSTCALFRSASTGRPTFDSRLTVHGKFSILSHQARIGSFSQCGTKCYICRNAKLGVLYNKALLVC